MLNRSDSSTTYKYNYQVKFLCRCSNKIFANIELACGSLTAILFIVIIARNLKTVAILAAAIIQILAYLANSEPT